MSSSVTRALDEPTLAALAEAILGAACTAGLCVMVVANLDQEVPDRIFVGDGITEILGYTPDELRTIPKADLTSPEENARVYGMYQRSMRGEPLPKTFELTLLHKSGSPVLVEAALSPVVYRGKSAVVLFFRDIGERSQAQLALQRSEARFRTLIESVPDVICVSRQGRVLYANPAFIELAGYKHADEVLGRALADMVHDDERPVVQGRLQRVDSGSPMLSTQEYRVRRPDGRPVTAEFFAIPIDFEGAPAALSFGRDITERQRLHEQLVQSARMAALGVVAAGVAHEINNPLAYVLLNLGFLARELPNLIDDDKARERVLSMLQAVREGTDRVAVIARDMRSLAREGGVGPADLRVVLDSCLNILGGELRQRARVVRDYGEVPSIPASPERLGQLFLNLVLNAAQSLPLGASELNEVRVTVRLGGPGQAVVEISDTGVGIPPELQERIFDPFFTTKPLGVGTGLGLSICQGIVASLHGEITVESAPGRGTTFRVTLPTDTDFTLVAPKTSEPPPLSAPRSSPVPGARPRLLIIDDERALAKALSAALEDRYAITIATAGQDGLDHLLTGQNFELILCDLLMPGVTGMDIHARVKEARPRLASRMIFMTGAPLMPAVAAFLERVPNTCLHKPIDLETLETHLEQLANPG